MLSSFLPLLLISMSFVLCLKIVQGQETRVRALLNLFVSPPPISSHFLPSSACLARPEGRRGRSLRRAQKSRSRIGASPRQLEGTLRVPCHSSETRRQRTLFQGVQPRLVSLGCREREEWGRQAQPRWRHTSTRVAAEERQGTWQRRRSRNLPGLLVCPSRCETSSNLFRGED